MSRLPAGLFALLLVLGGSASAGDETHRYSFDSEVRAWSPWPATAQKGWAPLYLEIHNASDESHDYRLRARSNDFGSERLVESSLEVPAGERVALELLLPLGGLYTSQFGLQVRCEDETLYFGNVVGGRRSVGLRHVLVVGDFEPAAGDLERWSEEISDAVLPDTVQRFFGSGPPPPTKSNNIVLTHARPEVLPRQHAAYSSLDLVVIDTRGALPDEEHLAALAAWVRLGGDVLFVGESALKACRASSALAPWTEARFARTREAGAEYRCGLGRLLVAEGPGDVLAQTDLVRALLAENASLTPENGPWRGSGWVPTIPGLSALPRRTFTLLLLLFAAVIGPVNFLAVRRRRNPALLLITIPSIAVLTTLALLAYGILYQGIDVKSASHSVAVLDQRTHRSACVEAREFFAGLSPAAGLRPGPGTVLHAVPDGAGRRDRFVVALERVPLLKGDYLPSRRRADQVLAVERAERARLDVHRTAGGLSVANNLGVVVRGLLVRDPEGGFHGLESPLEPGQEATLEPLASDVAVDARVGRLLDGGLPPRNGKVVPQEQLVPASYLAALDASPFRDACGVETTELEGRHLLWGVLSQASGDWR